MCFNHQSFTSLDSRDVLKYLRKMRTKKKQNCFAFRLNEGPASFLLLQKIFERSFLVKKSMYFDPHIFIVFISHFRFTSFVFAFKNNENRLFYCLIQMEDLNISNVPSAYVAAVVIWSLCLSFAVLARSRESHSQPKD